ncbi:UDP-N-acetylmuramyl-tripeptide synthetase [Patescibacteria group bacterium]|nr:UDP-N-acetylmuramyl-tripeptide synthetase [Patescibacteria group bacterium]
METFFRLIKLVIPKPVLGIIQPPYHFLLAVMGVVLYKFPSRKIYIVGVTGTKGKTSTVELINAMLEEAGLNTALANTIRFKIGDKEERNLFKMTMPGRFFMQKFLRDAVDACCSHAVIEMTSEGVKQFRHKFIELDALVFTNLSPEHIESHGTFQNYVQAKLKLKTLLEKSSKNKKTIIANMDDKFGESFLNARVEHRVPYSLLTAEPYNIRIDGVALTFHDVYISSPLKGLFSVYNIIAAASFAWTRGVKIEQIKRAVEGLATIPGRVELIYEGQDFTAVVDYAHTPDSLEKVYKAFPGRRLVCVLGNTGGGRDVRKRPLMGQIADEYCAEIILTDEDPYNEDPVKIINDMKKGFKHYKPIVIMDRRLAIRAALEKAKKNDVVLITGKGTDPYIMRARGKKEVWSDADVVREELKRISPKKY